MVTNLLSREFLELMRAHLEEGGFAYYNTTSSDAALKTGCTVFPHCLRFRNFLAVSDSPLSMDEKHFDDMLFAYRLEGKTILDPAHPEYQKLLDNVHSWIRESETRDKLLGHLEHAPIITDDNMIQEWSSNKIPYNVDPMAYIREEWLGFF